MCDCLARVLRSYLLLFLDVAMNWGKTIKKKFGFEDSQFWSRPKMRHVIGLCLLLSVSCFSSELRDPRWFTKQTRTIVRTFKTSKVVVETTPSSCVVVENNLPPCRHLRSFWPFVSATTRMTQTKAPNLHKPYEEPNWKPVVGDPSNKPTPPLTVKSSGEVAANPPPSWDWDIFNLGPKEVTVTKTIEQIYTTKVYDPNTVVTFSVKGCRPSRLPFDLSECKAPEPVPQLVPEKSVIVMAPVQFVHSLDPVEVPAPSETKVKESKDVAGVPPANATSS